MAKASAPQNRDVRVRRSTATQHSFLEALFLEDSFLEELFPDARLREGAGVLRSHAAIRLCFWRTGDKRT
jgi:hypothetical protein